MTHLNLSPIFKKRIFSIAFIIFLSVIGCIAAEQNRVCFKDKCFNVELAVNPEELYQGLMFRERLDYDKGMLFIFEEPKKYGFWMKNTYIPLDIIWINQEKEVVFIKRGAQPCQNNLCQAVYPESQAKYVLEVNAGVVGDIGLNLGDKLTFDLQQ